MFDLQNINQKLLGFSLLATISFLNINGASATLIKTKRSSNLNNQNQTLIEYAKKQQIKNWHQENKSAQNYLFKSKTTILAQYSEGDSLFNLDPSSLGKYDSEEGGSKTKLVRIIAFSFFLLLFASFGIYYPFFLFYKKLLNLDLDEDLGDEALVGFSSPAVKSKKPYIYLDSEYPESDYLDSEYLESDYSDSEYSESDYSDSEYSESDLAKDNSQVTVSKLQIAFLANDNNKDIRKQLAELCSTIDPRTDLGTVELMRETISFLIERDEVTHVSCSSQFFELEEAEEKFEIISSTEKNKIAKENLCLINSNYPESRTSVLASQNNNLYAVVTLIFCTSQTKFLPEEINTKKQLATTLSEFSEDLDTNELIKFDLLWNPEEEDAYLSNSELLLKYIDMMRLF